MVISAFPPKASHVTCDHAGEAVSQLGSIVPMGHSKAILPPEVAGGRGILVNDGGQVRAGDTPVCAESDRGRRAAR